MADNYINKIYELIGNNDELKSLIDKLVEERNNLLEEITYDELTKTRNRRVLDKETNYDVVVMCDIDDFKGINDNFGHAAGDNVLKVVSKLLKTITRGDDFVCRYGGDEFVIVLKKCSPEDASNKLEIIQQELNTVSNLGVSLTLSFGMTKYEEGKTLEDALIEADQALYKSKNNGKNKISMYKKR